MISEELLRKTFQELRSLSSETETFEFKEAKNSFDFGRLGKYFSALSNEANLKGSPYAWLVFGIEDKLHKIVGTKFRPERKDLDSLKGEIANKTTNRITFIEIYELNLAEGRVIMFQIPAALKGFPIAFEGHYYGRDGEELVPLNLQKIELIRRQNENEDWSAGIISDAGLEDLDPKAIAVARLNYKTKSPEKITEVDSWDDIKFLNKAKITIKGKITRTAILLLGKEESEHYINPAEAKIRWVLKDANNNDRDYSIECCPFLLAIDKIYAKIRNLKYRYITEGTLFPEEVDTYEPYTIREALNNCIAHQDYTKGGRINVIEFDDKLVFTNYGSFIPGSVDKVIADDAPEEHYRNKFLANAMYLLKMVDTAGGGIKKIFNYQRDRFFPMPDYDLSESKVKVQIIGKVLNLDYARVLARNKELTLQEIMLLDKVQKNIELKKEDEKYLRAKKLIEGRKPNYFLSIQASQKAQQKVEYTKNKAFDKKYYLDFILGFIKQHGKATRPEIENLLWSKLPEWMNDNQRKNKITNLISELRMNSEITNTGKGKDSNWVLLK
jgi:ATP-dependent DNA helicase RecG